MISNERTNELFREYRKTGNVAIRNEIIENYIYVAEILAKKFVGRGVEYDDLLQIASEALIMGVEKFDPDMGNKFTTFITPTITGIICNYFRDKARTIKVPRKIYELSTKVKEAVNEYYKANGVKPTAVQIAEMLGRDVESIIEAMEYKSMVSLDVTVKGDENDTPLYDVIADNKNDFEALEDSEALHTEIKKLSPIEQKIIMLRYVQGKSQSEVGKMMNVSQMYVSRIERKVIEKLKEALSE